MSTTTTVVWDFDWSMIDDNSDTFIVKQLLPADEYKALMKDKRAEFPVWTDLMQQCFLELHRKGFDTSHFDEVMARIPVHADILELIRELHLRGVAQYIVSDANTVLISAFLRAHTLEHVFVDRIFTNPAEFHEHGHLEVKYYHEEPHNCGHCPRNMCKGDILSSKIQTSDSSILYIGDGRGDLCPCLRLGIDDYILPRVGYPLLLCLGDPPAKVSGSILPWGNGAELAAEIGRRCLATL